MKIKKELKQKRGLAVLIGASTLSATHYGSSLPYSSSIERDIADFEMMAKLGGMEVKTIQNEEATRQQVLSNIAKTAKNLNLGDFLLIYFSGYGGNIANFAGVGTQIHSPTWCLFDAQILHSEIIASLNMIQSGVDVLIVSDCSNNFDLKTISTEQKANPRVLQKGIIDTVYLANKDFYDSKSLAMLSSSAPSANIVWLKACQPNQVSYENDINGFLTNSIKHVWNGGLYNKKYYQFMQDVILLMPPYQSPSIEIVCGNATNLFAQKPLFV
ncbi:MAG: caspase family protein [Saprospiraceae bacterium]|nr:caspase family protein [Saprospiraceae bacterium]